MNNTILYLLQTTTIFSGLYFIYILFLEKLTFHNLNRFVLLSLIPIATIIPFSDSWFPSLSSKIIEIPLFEHITTFKPINTQLKTIQEPLTISSFSYIKVILFIYWFVFSIFIIRIFRNTRQLFILKKKSIIHKKRGYQLVTADVPEIFSYFNWIFIPKNTIDICNSQILEHEKIHITLKHSWDVILSEVYIAFFWFNPLIYLYRRSLKSVHEFQADKGVLKSGVKMSQYMQLLLESLEIQKPNNLYNYFKQPILKKRVTMMIKPNSNRFSKLSYILFFSICVVLISAFTKPITQNSPIDNTFKASELTIAPPSLFPVKNVSKKNISAYYGLTKMPLVAKKKRFHKGIDIPATIGTPIFATANGIIETASLKGNWGNLIIMKHSDGYETWYAHLNNFNVIKNQMVKKGDVIGYVGNTGRSTGPHLHYEVKHKGKNVNPIDYIK